MVLEQYPRHGIDHRDRHIDHTELDIELRSTATVESRAALDDDSG